MTKELYQSSSAELTELKEMLAEVVTNLHFGDQPELMEKYGKAGKQKCKEDCLFHLSYLAEAVRLESSEIFTSYLQWAKVMLDSRDIPVEDLAHSLNYLNIASRQLLSPNNYQIVSTYIVDGVESLKCSALTGSFLNEANPLRHFAEKYLSLLLKAKRREAQVLIDELLKKGYSLPEIYEHIFAATQYELGRLWQTNKITVAHEHFCTAATQQIMSTLYPLVFNAEKKRYKMLACTISGGLHELGIRMIADLFERDGWDTYYMGASMPDRNIISAAKEQDVDIVAISVSMLYDINKVEGLIKEIRIDVMLNKVKIIVGGHPFNLVPDLWKRVGADGWARNAQEAVELANQMIGNKNIKL